MLKKALVNQKALKRKFHTSFLTTKIQKIILDLKTDLNIRFKDFSYTKINLSLKYILK